MSKHYILVNKGKGTYDSSNPITTDDLLRLDQDVVEDKNLVFEQLTATNNWTINHGLNKRPSIEITDLESNTVNAKITYVDNNQVTITFNTPFAGYAIFN